jgi:cobalt/nickel transport system ATP-binding protein
MSGPLVELDGVRFAYPGGPEILAGADLGLEPGERLGLIGPIGSGKTTLLHLVVGLLKPSAGTVQAFGRARRTEADFHEVRTRAGLVFQDPDDQLFCPTVIEDVAFGPLNLGRSPEEARSQAVETLDRVGLAGFEGRVTYRLSGGEKRLAALATVLAMEPEVLLLDEPTGGLDAASKDRICRVLSALPQAMILVTHEEAFLRDLTPRRVHLTSGVLEPCQH